MVTPLQAVETSGIGILIGLLGGLFGKGGSAVATPLLSLIGLPGFVAVASPLPATTPGTLLAAWAYWRAGVMDGQVVRWGIAVGIPATAAGAWLSRFTGATPLLIVTALLVLGFGLSFLLRPQERYDRAEGAGRSPAPVRWSLRSCFVRRQAGVEGSNPARGLSASPGYRQKKAGGAEETDLRERPPWWRTRMVAIGVAVGLISGLLANSGGFLLAPLYARFLNLRLKVAFACSLLVSAVLAVPGTVVHWYLGHISWLVTLLIAVGSVPLSYAGARLAIHTPAQRLERWYGVALTVLGVVFLFHH